MFAASGTVVGMYSTPSCRYRALSPMLLAGIVFILGAGIVTAQAAGPSMAPSAAAPGSPPGVTQAAQALQVPGSAQAGQDASGDPLRFLGHTPAEVVGELGAPLRVYAVRGAEPWQDDVVFEYSSGLSLFLFGDRVWQVRVSGPLASGVRGALPGMTVDAVSSLLGDRGTDSEGYREWSLNGQAWPLRLRALTGEDGLVTELYAYRADF